MAWQSINAIWKSEIDDRRYFLTEHMKEYDLYDLAEGKIIK